MTLPFENDTGPVIKKLASRSIQTDKRRNLFVIVTIALAAALMAAIFCAGAGSDRKLEADIRGQYQAVVVNCDRDTIERLKDCPEVERWGLSQNYGSARYGDSVLTVEYADANWMELGKKPSFTGTLPQAANEILVERAFLDYFEIPAEVGQSIEVDWETESRPIPSAVSWMWRMTPVCSSFMYLKHLWRRWRRESRCLNFGFVILVLIVWSWSSSRRILQHSFLPTMSQRIRFFTVPTISICRALSPA